MYSFALVVVGSRVGTAQVADHVAATKEDMLVQQQLEGLFSAR